MEKEKIDYLLNYFLHLLPQKEKHNLEYPYLSFDEKKLERENVANVLWEKYKDEIYLNKCPKCNKIARTPKAKQCRFCRYDWH
jgi:hypothetical protein